MIVTIYLSKTCREKLHNGKLKQDFLDDIFSISSYTITIGYSLILEVLHTLAFLYSTYFCLLSLFFLSIFSFSFSYLPFFLFIGTSLALISIVVLLPTALSEIFFFTLSVSSLVLSWRYDFWGCWYYSGCLIYI